MAYSAGYSTVLKAGGTATSFTDEATTTVTANTVYQITDATKRVLDPATAIVVNVDGSPAAAADYSVDLFTGTVTFGSDQGASVITVTGKYIPLFTIGTARNFSLDVGREEYDTSVYSETAASAAQGRIEASGSFEFVENLLTDHDSGAGTLTLSGFLTGGVPVFLESQPGGSGSKFRMWALVKGNMSMSVSDVVTGSMSFTVINRQNGDDQCSISYAA